jgi:hypothetical protein
MRKRHFGEAAVAGACAILVGVSAQAAESLSPRADYLSVQEQIESGYRAAREKCNELNGNARDLCMVEAKAKQRIEKAEAEARVKGTPRARYDASVIRAEAEYQMAKERCAEQTRESKDAKETCIREAQDIEARAKAAAQSEWRAAEAREVRNNRR